MDASLTPGTTVGVHHLERLLGRGGMGAVFLAYDTRLQHSVDAGGSLYQNAQGRRSRRRSAAPDEPSAAAACRRKMTGPRRKRQFSMGVSAM
jgi:hypothetical protein